MDSRPEALTHKARIAIQIQPSGCQSARVWTRAQQIRKLCVEDQSAIPLVQMLKALVRK
jgi:hypothetical protein